MLKPTLAQQHRKYMRLQIKEQYERLRNENPNASASSLITEISMNIPLSFSGIRKIVIDLGLYDAVPTKRREKEYAK